MAITLEKFVKITHAEEVAGNVIVGVMSTRQIVGTVSGGVFNLNDAGKEIAEQIEAGTYGLEESTEVAAAIEAELPKASKASKTSKTDN